MARVPYVRREDLGASEQPFHDRMHQTLGVVSGPYQLFLNSPDLAARLADVQEYVRFQIGLDDATREIVILTVAQELRGQYIWTLHEPLARKAGVRELVINGIKNRTTRGMIPQEMVFVDYTRQILSKRVNDPTFAAIEHLIGRRGAVNLTLLAGYYAFLCYSMDALGIELPEGTGPLLPTS